MKTYNIVDTNIDHFKGCSVPFDFENKLVGDVVNVFGANLTITQKGSTVVALSNKTQVFVFQEVVLPD